MRQCVGRIALVLVLVAGCAGRERREAESETETATETETGVESETATETEPESGAEGEGGEGVVPEWLVRSLAPVSEPEPSVASPIERCAMGCAYRAADGSMLVVTPRYLEEDGTPARVELATLQGDEPSRRTIQVDAIRQRAWERYREAADDGAPPPWVAWLAGQMRLTLTHRPASDLVAARATRSHGLSEYAPLVELGGPLRGRLLYLEIGETAYRLHLVSADGSRARLLARWPLDPTACEGGSPLSPCVEPRGIAAVYEGTSSRQLLVQLDHPIPGHGGAARSLEVVSLADADALDPRIDEASRAADLERSLRAPGARIRLFREPPAGATCFPHCAWFAADGRFWLVRGERVREGWIARPRIFEPDGDREVLVPPDADGGAVVPAIESALEGRPGRAARHIVLREAHASWRGTIHAPRVELGAPHAGRRLEVRDDGDDVVVSWVTGAGSVPAGRTRLPRRGAERGPPGIVDVVIPDERGFPLLVIGARVRSLGTVDRAVEHDLFHVVVRRGPES